MAEEGEHLQTANNQKDAVVHDNGHGGKPNQVTLNPQQLGDIIMAEVDTVMLEKDLADIRREGAEHTGTLRYNIKEGTNEGVKETLKAGWAGVDATKDARHDVNSRIDATRQDLSAQVDAIDDTLTAQASNYFIAGQQYAFQNARDVAALKASTDMGFAKAFGDIQTAQALSSAASALESAKVAAAVALGQAQLERTILADGGETRRLINELKVTDLNRMLIERNAEIVEERGHARHWRGNYDNAQFAALTTQLNSFQSQLAETRQGMVNFGTMAGVGQTSTANNVR